MEYRIKKHEAYSSTTPVIPTLPIVVESPHDSTQHPKDAPFSCAPIHHMKQVDWGIGDMVIPVAKSHGASTLKSEKHRCYIDFNRSARHMHPDHILGDTSQLDVSENSLYAKAGLGVVQTIAYLGSDVRLVDPLPTQQEVLSRIDKYWRPYHAQLDHHIQNNIDNFGHSLHLSCHSFPLKNMREKKELEGSTFFLGTIDHKTADPEILSLTKTFLESQGYGVKCNHVLKGMELVRQHGKPCDNKHSIQIEIVRESYMDVDTFEINQENFCKLQTIISDLIQTLGQEMIQRSHRKPSL